MKNSPTIDLSETAERPTRRIRRGLAVAAIAATSVAGLSLASGSVSAQTGGDPADTALTQAPADGERRGPGRAGKLAVAAEAIGIDVEDLRTQIRDGATVAEVAEANGVSSDAVVDAIVQAKLDRLAQAVEDGRLTQDEADEKALDIEDCVTTRLEEGRPDGPRGPSEGGGRGGPGGNEPAGG